jgi:hypothetical protein
MIDVFGVSASAVHSPTTRSSHVMPVMNFKLPSIGAGIAAISCSAF